MKIDFAKFSQNLPYASELYGIYQPLLGWRSKLQTSALNKGIADLKGRSLASALSEVKPVYRMLEEPLADGRSSFEVQRGSSAGLLRTPLQAVDSVIARNVLERVAEAGEEEPDVWKKFTSPDVLDRLLADSHDEIASEYRSAIADIGGHDPKGLLIDILQRESTVAGALAHLNATQSPQAIADFLKPVAIKTPSTFINIINLFAGRQSKLLDAAISPIGVVHLLGVRTKTWTTRR